MIQSMTGYGAGRCSNETGTVHVELRSLNSKFLEIFIRMPFQDAVIENEVRGVISRELSRGKISVSITLEGETLSRAQQIDDKAFKAYYQQLEKVLKSSGMKAKLKASDILGLPGVIHSNELNGQVSFKDPMMEALTQACQALQENRKAEGHVLEQDMDLRCGLIEQYLKAVTPFEEARTQTIRTRMQQHLRDYLGKEDINQDRFEQELIFYLEKLDITEEKIRLQAHLDYFRKTMESEEMPGKKLGFITQEMGREINTLGSKANDASIQKLVVGMKDELEKIKEQTANIL
jgi:uncharacterized protein (TIGR00255 family)